jgi:hypothetical protein
MANDVCISSVKIDPQDGTTVTFSDVTLSGYVVQELLELRHAGYVWLVGHAVKVRSFVVHQS